MTTNEQVRLTAAQLHMPHLADAIQYPLPPGPVHPWVNRVLNAYLKDSGTLGRLALQGSPK